METSVGWRIARIGAGVALLVLGVLGLFLPVLQGVLFLVMGLTLLSEESRHAQWALTWMKNLFPQRQPVAKEWSNGPGR